MREIKFRAWDEKTKTMHNVIGFDRLNVYTDTWDGGSGSEVLFRYRSEKVQYIPAILLQYTGLKDKNGVDMWEGDIVNVHSYTVTGLGKVGFNKGSFVFNKFEYPTSQVLHSFSEIEVIGNIYENPELLENN